MSETPKTVSGSIVVTGELHRVQKGRRKAFAPEPERSPAAEAAPSRLALTLALAHAIQRAIDSGELRDQADAARALGLTRARLTQILDLTLLAPDIQERVLLGESGSQRHDLAHRLRAAARLTAWSDQRRALEAEVELTRYPTSI